MKLDAMKVAMVFGVLLGGWHLAWVALILIGFAQTLLDFVFWLHMIGNPYHVTGFSGTQAILLVIVTFVVGYVVGLVFAWVWNKLHKK